MIDNVIYFPYINVPTNEWFTRVLLYWDEAGSIVPSDYVTDPKKLPVYMRELLNVRLIKLVEPGKYIHKIPNFDKAFTDMISSNTDIMRRCGVSIERGETSRIHIEKFSPLAYDLCDMGLAREAEYPWYEVERTTADLFMAYLAAVLGQCEDLEMNPITDRAEYFSVFSSSPQIPSGSSYIIDELRVSVLEGVLPAPSLPVAVQDLAEFKGQHHDLLSKFRRHIESSLTDIAAIPDQFLRNRKMDILKDELKDGIDEIRNKMHERRWPDVVFGTLCGLIAAAFPGASAIATGDVSSALLAFPGLMSAIYSAFKGVAGAQKVRRPPLAYAALAQEKFA